MEAFFKCRSAKPLLRRDIREARPRQGADEVKTPRLLLDAEAGSASLYVIWTLVIVGAVNSLSRRGGTALLMCRTHPMHFFSGIAQLQINTIFFKVVFLKIHYCSSYR